MAKKGQKMSDDFREKMRKIRLSHPIKFFLGKKMSEEHRRRLSLSKMGNQNRLGTVGVWKGKKMSLEHRKKMSEAHKGEKAYNFKNYPKGINYAIRRSSQYREWRKKIFERDNYTCISCKARCKSGQTVYLHADHIKPFALFPELRFLLENGRTLCISCHKKTETYGGKTRI